MKWPVKLLLIRHNISEYNALRRKKECDPLYQKFLSEWENNFVSKQTIELAKIVTDKFAMQCGDWETPLDSTETERAVITGKGLRKEFDTPDVIFISPYERTKSTLESLCMGWPELKNVTTVEDERIREQEHGLANLYNDWRVFHTMYPEQHALYEYEGSYWYRYPQGENVPDMRARNRDWLGMLTREYRDKNVFAITHHLNILALRANLERFGHKEFIRIDEKEKPKNCGVTLYTGNALKGKDGKLELTFYNKLFC